MFSSTALCSVQCAVCSALVFIVTMSRWGHSCARLGDKLVVAGGVSPSFSLLSTTTVLDLGTRQQREVGEMGAARAWFAMAAAGGRLVAFGGMGPFLRNAWGDIEEWDDEAETWVKTDTSMATAMSSFAYLVVNADDICMI